MNISFPAESNPQPKLITKLPIDDRLEENDFNPEAYFSSNAQFPVGLSQSQICKTGPYKGSDVENMYRSSMMVSKKCSGEKETQAQDNLSEKNTILTLQSELTQVKEEAKVYKQEIETLKGSNDFLKENCDKSNGRLVDALRKVTQLENKEKELHTKVKDTEEQKHTLRKVSSYQNILMKKDLQIEEKKTDNLLRELINYRRIFSSIEAERQKEKQLIYELQKENYNLRESMGRSFQSQSVIESLKEDKKNLFTLIDQLREKIVGMESENGHLKRTCQEKEDSVGSLKEINDSLSQQVVALKAEVETKKASSTRQQQQPMVEKPLAVSTLSSCKSQSTLTRHKSTSKILTYEEYKLTKAVNAHQQELRSYKDKCRKLQLELSNMRVLSDSKERILVQNQGQFDQMLLAQEKAANKSRRELEDQIDNMSYEMGEMSRQIEGMRMEIGKRNRQVIDKDVQIQKLMMVKQVRF